MPRALESDDKTGSMNRAGDRDKNHRHGESSSWDYTGKVSK